MYLNLYLIEYENMMKNYKIEYTTKKLLEFLNINIGKTKLHNMGTNQKTFIDYLVNNYNINNVEYIRIKLVLYNNVSRFKTFIKSYDDSEREFKIFNLDQSFPKNISAKSTLYQKLQILKKAKIIDDFNINENKIKNMETKIFPNKKFYNKENWNSKHIIFQIIKNALQNLGKSGHSIGLTYLLSYFCYKIPNEFIQILTSEDSIIKKLTLRNNNKTKYSDNKIEYLYDFLVDKKNNFNKQWEEIENQSKDNEIFNEIKKIILNNINVNFEELKVSEYKQKKIKKIYYEAAHKNLRVNQIVWKALLVKIRKFQGRKRCDLGLEAIDSKGVEAAHLMEASVCAKIIINEIKNKNFDKAEEVYINYHKSQNGLLLPSTHHRKYDQKEYKLIPSKPPKFIDKITNKKVCFEFAPDDSFVYRPDLNNYRRK